MLIIFGRLAFKEVINLVNTGATYTRVYEVICALQQRLGIYYNRINPTNFCDDIAKQIQIITGVVCKVSVVTELEVDSYYIILSKDRTLDFNKYQGLSYPDVKTPEHALYKRFEGVKEDFRLDKDSIIYKVEF
jgi:hypothetical protein